MADWIKLISIVLSGYVLGCFCSAYYLVRWKTGEDIRNLHSGTAGARNAGRVLGKAGFVLALFIDICKGAGAILMARWILPGSSVGEMLALAGALLGHIFPLQLGFRGGKGVSIIIGALLLVSPIVLGVMALLAGTLMVVMPRTNQGMIITIAILPFAAWWLCDAPAYIAGLSFSAIVVLFFHRSNIRDILSLYNIGKTE